jgi:hypothetical protein
MSIFQELISETLPRQKRRMGMDPILEGSGAMDV